MVVTTRTNSNNKNFQELVRELDVDLANRDGKEHSFYGQFNKIEGLQYVVVAYEQEKPVGCGALKEYSQGTVEVKRMYVPPEKRGQGIASIILKELEKWGKELGYRKCILETGKKQHEALGLYKKSNYLQIPNYGQYVNVENSVCFEKEI